MRHFGVVPVRHLGLLLVAAVAAPAVVKGLRPLVKAAGKGVKKTGEFLEKLADEAEREHQERKARREAEAGTTVAEASPNGDVSAEPIPTEAAEVDPNTASPTGREELHEHAAAEAAGDGASPDPVVPKRKTRKTVEPDQKLNPRRTKNSRPD